MLKKINAKDAVGTRLAHDITEIRPGEFKGPAFRKDHEVCNEDICHLQKLGKNHLYLLDLEDDEIHENQAASILARGLAGAGVTWRDDPREGKIGLHAGLDGLLVVDTASLAAVAYGHTVLSEACSRANIEFDPSRAHSALYDAERTAELFCAVVNTWDQAGLGVVPAINPGADPDADRVTAGR